MQHENKWRVSKRRLSVVNDAQKITLRVYAPHHNAVATMKDLQLTVDRVCDLLNGCDKLLRNERDTLQAELARVREALKPFANIDIRHWKVYKDDRIVWAVNDTQVTVGDIRKAQAIIQPSRGEQG